MPRRQNATSRLAEEWYAGIVLKALHLQSDGRRSAAKLLRCLCKASKVVCYGKGAEGIQIQIDSRCHGLDK